MQNVGFPVIKDLTKIFAPLSSATKAAATGYISSFNGLDFNQIFEPYVSGEKAFPTGYKLAGTNIDLSDVFKPMVSSTYSYSYTGGTISGTLPEVIITYTTSAAAGSAAQYAGSFAVSDPSAISNLQILQVSGGAGGGSCSGTNHNSAGGGGGGHVVNSSITLTPNSYNFAYIYIGCGGLGAINTRFAQTSSNSSLSVLYGSFPGLLPAIGYGLCGSTTTVVTAGQVSTISNLVGAGAGGGGGAFSNSNGANTALGGTSTTGGRGGNAKSNDVVYTGKQISGGGGGGGTQGQPGTDVDGSGNKIGNGGNGTTINGVIYGGGGGAGGPDTILGGGLPNQLAIAAAGGAGGGGAGGGNGVGINGINGLGGGGGGGNAGGGNGGNGIVVIRFNLLFNSYFTLSTIAPISSGTIFSGYFWGCASAKLGIGYVSGYHAATSEALLFKTTDYGRNFSKITVPNGGIRGVATNANNNKLVIAYSDNTVKTQVSSDGGGVFTTILTNLQTQSCIMTSDNSNNYIVTNQNNDTIYRTFYSIDNYSTGVSNLNLAPNITNNKSGANSISNTPNVFVTTLSGNAVYRNVTNGNISSSITAVTITYGDGALNAKYVGTACNANNSVNFIVNRTTTTGGKIYRSTAWNATFTEVTGSPIALWQQIATSSTGNVVCAIADTSIYVSIDAGLNWRNVSYTHALQSNEGFSYVTVSPDEKFIIIGTNGYLIIGQSLPQSRIFYCVL